MTTREDSIKAILVWQREADIRAAIEQALKDERIQTLEAVGCNTFGISQCADHYSKQTSWCTRCRMLAEARGERQE